MLASLLIVLIYVITTSSYTLTPSTLHRNKLNHKTVVTSHSCKKTRRSDDSFTALNAVNLLSALPTLTSAVSVAGVIAFHEAGHFLAAKWQGMRIESFNIGYGPKLFSFNDTDTGADIALRAVPLGGYVAFPANAEFNQSTGEMIKELDDPDLLQNRPPLQRAIVISAGVIANVILAFLLSTTAGIVSGIPNPIYDEGIVVTQLQSVTAPAAQAGLALNDVILTLNGKDLTATDSTIEDFVTTVRKSEGTPLLMDVRKAGSDKVIKTAVTPAVNTAGKVSIGLGINPRVKEVVTVKATNPVDAVVIGAKQTWKLIKFTSDAFYRAFSNGFTGNEVGGPISVVQAGAKMAESSPVALVGFAATLSINLAILNALPFPALDGGQLAFVLVELLSGKAVPRTIKETITGLAFGVLLLLGASTVAGDIGKSVLPAATTYTKMAASPGPQGGTKTGIKVLKPEGARD